MLAWAALTLVCLALLLLAEWWDSRRVVAIAKPLASTGFVGVALAGGATASGYGQAVLCALLLSWLGDVLLIPRGGAAAFRGGLSSFLLAHVAFAAAFAMRGVSWPWAGAALLLGVAIDATALRWLMPRVPGGLERPVRAYVVVITAMVVLAAGSFGLEADARILCGAVAFFLSDLAVARDRFVVDSFWNKSWGLPLYYGAQLLLAWSVTG